MSTPQIVLAALLGVGAVQFVVGYLFGQAVERRKWRPIRNPHYGGTAPKKGHFRK